MKTTIKLATLAAILSLAPVANAQVHWGFGIYVGTPPPPPTPRREIICEAPYPDAYWAPGYWNFNRWHRHYEWVPGRWARREMRRDWCEARRENRREDRREDRWEHRHGDRGYHRGWDHADRDEYGR